MKGGNGLQLFSGVTKGKGFLCHISGLSKLIGFLFLTFAAMFSYDIRFILFMLVFSSGLIFLNRIPLKPLKLVFIYVSVFLVLNTFLTYLFEPEYGVTIYGTRNELTVLFGRYTITQEQLLYQVTKLLKYLSVIPLGILFLYTTDPSEFASSLSGIGVPYKVSYSLALTLRYFPDLQEDYTIISKAQQARGLELSKKTSLWNRLHFAIYTIIPLIFSTLDRIDSISNAMDLRRFGQYKTRNWYSKQGLTTIDYLAIGVSAIVFVSSILISILINQSRFFNPFL
jgi:energy-coupling factor transport system permease protein